jgi:hypothetical protein
VSWRCPIYEYIEAEINSSFLADVIALRQLPDDESMLS